MGVIDDILDQRRKKQASQVPDPDATSTPADSAPADDDRAAFIAQLPSAQATLAKVAPQADAAPIKPKPAEARHAKTIIDDVQEQVQAAPTPQAAQDVYATKKAELQDKIDKTPEAGSISLKSNGEKLAFGLMTILPTLLGGALGGANGAAAGADASLGGLNKLAQNNNTTNDARRKDLQEQRGDVAKQGLSNQEAKQALAKQQDEQDFQGGQGDLNRAKDIQVAQLSAGRMMDEKNDKRAQDLKKDLEPDAGRTGNFGQISQKKIAAERMDTLVNAFKGGNLPAAQMEELALGLASMIGGSGANSRDQVKALVPESAIGDVQKTKSWFLNSPQGANQQAFVQQMIHTVAREKETAQRQMKEIQLRRLSSHAMLKNKDPETYNNILHSYEISPEEAASGKPDSDKPETVTQGGHTYTLNHSTGQYE